MCLRGGGRVSTFQHHFNPFQSQKSDFFWIFSFCPFLEFFPRITPHQMEVGSWNLLCMLSKSPKCAFRGFQLFGVEIQFCPNLGEGVLRVQNCKNCLFPNLYNILKNHFSGQLLREDIGRGGRGFLLFELKKNYSFCISSPNWAREF